MSVDLSGNSLSDTDVEHLREALEENRTLTNLDLRANRVTKDSEAMSEIDRTVRANELDLRRY